LIAQVFSPCLSFFFRGQPTLKIPSSEHLPTNTLEAFRIVEVLVVKAFQGVADNFRAVVAQTLTE
jgi:hypothetical protein